MSLNVVLGSELAATSPAGKHSLPVAGSTGLSRGISDIPGWNVFDVAVIANF